MSKAIVNALTIALAMQEDMPLGQADAFAQRFVADNIDLFTVVVQQVTGPTAPTVIGGPVRPVSDQSEPNPQNPANRMTVPVRGPDGLTAAQRAAVESGIGLCPNCQQPTNDHLPGCARASGEDPKARTKSALPPVQ